MKILIVEDDHTTQEILDAYLSPHGECAIAEDGIQALEKVKEALKERKNYDLICLDIMMPNMDGHEALKHIRRMEEEHGIFIGDGAKIIMTTALSDAKNVMSSFKRKL